MPTVVLGGITLKNGADYTVKYANNVNAGKATATIVGKGSYAGSKKATFVISYSAMFADVNEKTYHVEDIIWLANNGISKGWEMKDGTLEFRPGQSSRSRAKIWQRSFIVWMA